MYIILPSWLGLAVEQPGPLSLVEECRGSTLTGPEMLLAPALLCHKEPARRIQSPQLGALERKIPLVLYGIRAPIMGPFRACMEATYPYAIKNHVRGILHALS